MKFESMPGATGSLRGYLFSRTGQVIVEIYFNADRLAVITTEHPCDALNGKRYQTLDHAMAAVEHWIKANPEQVKNWNLPIERSAEATTHGERPESPDTTTDVEVANRKEEKDNS